ncbi:MAG TPA: hypothetical protein CFH79_03920 [Sulfurospirillum sp. UBA11407]|nr:MAG TPA: hypothetical protein CFH79_03920 [Sulfurospirillum sp. UBA11407]
MDRLKEKLENIDLDINELDGIYEEYKDNAQVVNLIAMNISLRTSVKNREPEKCSTLSKILTKLSKSTDMATRWSVAKNPCTPIETLKELAHDKVNLVRALVATNPSSPKEILAKFFSDEKIVRDGLSGNPSTPAKYLQILADDKDKMVRLRIATNPSTPKDTLEKLCNDIDTNVQIKAKESLANETN